MLPLRAAKSGFSIEHVRNLFHSSNPKKVPDTFFLAGLTVCGLLHAGSKNQSVPNAHPSDLGSLRLVTAKWRIN
jgi:hypothetical protein